MNVTREIVSSAVSYRFVSLGISFISVLVKCHSTSNRLNRSNPKPLNRCEHITLFNLKFISEINKFITRNHFKGFGIITSKWITKTRRSPYYFCAKYVNKPASMQRKIYSRIEVCFLWRMCPFWTRLNELSQIANLRIEISRDVNAGRTVVSRERILISVWIEPREHLVRPIPIAI